MTENMPRRSWATRSPRQPVPLEVGRARGVRDHRGVGSAGRRLRVLPRHREGRAPSSRASSSSTPPSTTGPRPRRTSRSSSGCAAGPGGSPAGSTPRTRADLWLSSSSRRRVSSSSRARTTHRPRRTPRLSGANGTRRTMNPPGSSPLTRTRRTGGSCRSPRARPAVSVSGWTRTTTGEAARVRRHAGVRRLPGPQRRPGPVAGHPRNPLRSRRFVHRHQQRRHPDDGLAHRPARAVLHRQPDGVGALPRRHRWWSRPERRRERPVRVGRPPRRGRVAVHG